MLPFPEVQAFANSILPAARCYWRETRHGRMEAALSVGAEQEDALMAVVESRQASVPDRLLIALLHAGVAPEALQQRYGVSPDELAALKELPVEPLFSEDLEHLPEDGSTYELWKGALIRMSSGKIRHGSDAGQLAVKLGSYLDAHRVGRLLVAEPGFRVGPDNSVISPDLAFIRNERLGLFPPDEFGPVSPDLAVEVISPGNTGIEISEKVAAYLAGGARLVWVLDPKPVQVSVHRADGTTTLLGADDRLSWEELLPGFSVLVRELFI
jgi:Uma2 family endonuclease